MLGVTERLGAVYAISIADLTDGGPATVSYLTQRIGNLDGIELSGNDLIVTDIIGGRLLRVTPSTSGRLRAFAATQVALSFVLLVGAGMLLSALVALQQARTDVATQKVLAIDVPVPLEVGAQSVGFYEEATRRIARLPGVRHVAVGSFVPWRDVATLMPSFPFAVEGVTLAEGEESPRARLRNVSPGFFAALGVPILAGRDFSDEDRRQPLHTPR